MNTACKIVFAGAATGALAVGVLRFSPQTSSLPRAEASPAKVAAKEKPMTKIVQPSPLSPKEFAAYQNAIGKTTQMVSDARAQQLAQKYGLQILNLTWEDSGRYKDSSVGPNISDMTIQVGARDPKTEKFSVAAMPVIRFPNFSDKTADLDPRDFTLLVGNQAGRPLRRVSLRDFLSEPTAFLSRPWTWKSPNKSLLAPGRDDKVLVSAQACFLPIPQSGKATFNPVLFNYQSVKNDPAVLTILVTHEGASTTIIDNQRDAFESGSVWGQRLFHNANGQRASLTGERESEFHARGAEGASTPVVGEGEQKAGGLNMVLLIQVPLKQKNPMRFASDAMAMMAKPAPPAMTRREKSDVENAVIGHGDLEGPFTEIDNLEIERDPKFPVRVTVQFYKATSNGMVSEDDLKEIKAQIDRVYGQSDYVGSLVTQGETERLTEYEGVKVQPADWWEKFWQRHEKETGDSKEESIRKLRRLLGTAEYSQRPVSELYLRDLLRS